MSIQTELERLTNAKAAIRTAIEGKGVTVPSGTLLDGMAALIDAIEAGGNTQYNLETGRIDFASSYKPYTNPLVINHSLGKAPCLFFAVNGTSGSNPKYQIAFIGYCSYTFAEEMRVKNPFMIYTSSAGSDDVYININSNIVVASKDSITIGSATGIADFAPSGTSTMTWMALAKK